MYAASGAGFYTAGVRCGCPRERAGPQCTARAATLGTYTCCCPRSAEGRSAIVPRVLVYRQKFVCLYVDSLCLMRRRWLVAGHAGSFGGVSGCCERLVSFAVAGKVLTAEARIEGRVIIEIERESFF